MALLPDISIFRGVFEKARPRAVIVGQHQPVRGYERSRAATLQTRRCEPHPIQPGGVDVHVIGFPDLLRGEIVHGPHTFIRHGLSRDRPQNQREGNNGESLHDTTSFGRRPSGPRARTDRRIVADPWTGRSLGCGKGTPGADGTSQPGPREERGRNKPAGLRVCWIVGVARLTAAAHEALIIARNPPMPAVISFVAFALTTMSGTDPAAIHNPAGPLHEGGQYVRVMSDAVAPGPALSVAEGGLVADTPSHAASAPDAPHGTLLEGGRS